MFAGKKNNIFLSTNNKSVMLQILYCRGKTKVSLHSFARKTKVSYYITFFQTLLKTFSYGLCYSDRRIILSYCKKRKVNYYVCRQEEQYIPFNEQQKCHVTNIYTVEENKSIILHSFARKTKVSYYITFFQTLLRTFFVRSLSC